MTSLKVPAKRNQLDIVQDFVKKQLEKYACPPDIELTIEIAIEEIFVNIASYAYNPEDGDAEIKCEIEENPLCVTVQFMDNGVPFDPLAKEDADLSKEALLSRIGGLGIYMVKQSMDQVTYEYKRGMNILTIKKKF